MSVSRGAPCSEGHFRGGRDWHARRKSFPASRLAAAVLGMALLPDELALDDVLEIRRWRVDLIDHLTEGQSGGSQHELAPWPPWDDPLPSMSAELAVVEQAERSFDGDRDSAYFLIESSSRDGSDAPACTSKVAVSPRSATGFGLTRGTTRLPRPSLTTRPPARSNATGSTP